MTRATRRGKASRRDDLQRTAPGRLAVSNKRSLLEARNQLHNIKGGIDSMALYPTDGDLVNEKIQALNAAVLVWRAIQRLNAGRLSLAELAELDLGADVIEALYCREAAQGRRQ